MSDKRDKRDLFDDFTCKTLFTDVSELNPTQKNLVLAYRYSGAMNNGGHSSYFECYPEISPQELYDALMAIGVPDVAENYKAAVALEGEGIDDGYLVTDDIFYDLEQDFFEKMLDYVEAHKTEIGV